MPMTTKRGIKFPRREKWINRNPAATFATGSGDRNAADKSAAF